MKELKMKIKKDKKLKNKLNHCKPMLEMQMPRLKKKEFRRIKLIKN